jgi:PDZ domain-containing secreted protein
MYVKHLGLYDVEDSGKINLIELIVMKKTDILSNKLNFERVNNKEFRLNDNLYDIVKEVEKDSNIYFYCINDKREEELEKNFHKKMEENTQNGKQRTGNRITLKKIISEEAHYPLFVSANASKLNFASDFSSNYKSIRKEIPSPPPKDFS